MPKFNMSPDEAQSLANYFAAVDGAQYPYQPVPQRDPGYLEMKNAEVGAHLQSDSNYLSESWNLLNAPLCIKCHSVGGRDVRIGDPAKDIRGPNLEYTADRLRPDWLLSWMYNPAWLTPYTSMPRNFDREKPKFKEIFGGNGETQVIGIRDALMNYHWLMEEYGKTVYESPAESTATGAEEGD
jgi:hypothetical protein